MLTVFNAHCYRLVSVGTLKVLDFNISPSKYLTVEKMYADIEKQNKTEVVNLHSKRKRKKKELREPPEDTRSLRVTRRRYKMQLAD